MAKTERTQDPNQAAKRLLDIITGEKESEKSQKNDMPALNAPAKVKKSHG